MRGRGGHRSGWPYAARRTRTPVSGRCSRSAAVMGSWFVVLAEVTPRAASELRLADAARSGRPSRPPGGRLLGLNGIGPGLWARPAA